MSEPTPELGIDATVFIDEESHGPRTIAPNLGLTSAEDYFDGGDNIPRALIENISIVSRYTLHQALYALQNPTAENIQRALYRIGTSGDCEHHVDSDTLMPLPVPEPPGWNDWVPWEAAS